MPHYGNGESPAYETFHESSQHKIFYSQNLLLHLSHKASCFHACKELSVLLTLFFRHLLYESFCIFAYFLKHHIWLNFICKDSTFHLIIQSFLCFLSFFIFLPSSHTPSCSFCLRNQCLSNGLGRRHKVPSQRKSEGDWSTRHNLPHE